MANSSLKTMKKVFDQIHEIIRHGQSSSYRFYRLCELFGSRDGDQIRKFQRRAILACISAIIICSAAAAFLLCGNMVVAAIILVVSTLTFSVGMIWAQL